MRYTDWVIPRLKNLQQERDSLTYIPERIHTLELSYSAIRSATTDSTPVSGGTSHREDALLSNIAERDQLKKNLVITRREVAQVEEALSKLSETDRLVLERFFINRHKGHVERLCEELNCEVANVYKLKDRALIEFARRLYGQVNL